MEYRVSLFILTVMLCFPTQQYGQVVQATTYTIDKKELYYDSEDKTHKVFVDYPVLTGGNQAVISKINQYLLEQFTPEDKSLVQSTTEENYDNLSSAEYISFHTEWHTDKYLCLTKKYTAESKGTPHDSWGNDYYHFDMETGDVLNFRDMFDEGIYDAISKIMMVDFRTLPVEQLEKFDARQLKFDFYVTENECYEEGEACLMLYFAPYTDVGGLTSAGYVGWNTYIPERDYMPYMKKKWRTALFKQ